MRRVANVKSTFDFRLIHPDEHLKPFIQAIWSASVSSTSAPVSKPLFSDGSSGVFINLKGTIVFNGETFEAGAFWTPVKHKAEFIELSPGNCSVGFRFHPAAIPSELGAIGTALFAGEREHGSDQGKDLGVYPVVLDDLINRLSPIEDLDQLIDILAQWLSDHIDLPAKPSSALSQAVAAINTTSDILSIEQFLPLSLRQIERQFKNHTGITPKHYQRLLRIKSAIETIKQTPNINLADLALQTGYSDQAHMTREFRKLAEMTPSQYQKARLDK